MAILELNVIFNVTWTWYLNLLATRSLISCSVRLEPGVFATQATARSPSSELGTLVTHTSITSLCLRISSSISTGYTWKVKETLILSVLAANQRCVLPTHSKMLSQCRIHFRGDTFTKIAFVYLFSTFGYITFLVNFVCSLCAVSKWVLFLC